MSKIQKYMNTTTITEKGAVVRIENLAFHFAIYSNAFYLEKIIALDVRENLFDFDKEKDHFFANENTRVKYLFCLTRLCKQDLYIKPKLIDWCLKALKRG